MLGLYPVVLVDFFFFLFFFFKKKTTFYALYSVATLFFLYLWPLWLNLQAKSGLGRKPFSSFFFHLHHVNKFW